MAYLDNDYEGYDDESISTLLESDGGSWSAGGNGEAVGPRYQRNAGRNRGTSIPRPQPARPVGGLGGATLNTPAGRAEMKFEKPVATKESVDAAVRELKAELAAIAATVKKVDDTVDKNTAILDKKVAALEGIQKKAQQGSQMGMLLPMLLSKPPELESLTVKGDATGANAADKVLAVTATKYKAGDNLGLLIAIMSMSGGGLGGGSNDSMNMLLPLLLVGGLGGTK